MAIEFQPLLQPGAYIEQLVTAGVASTVSRASQPALLIGKLVKSVKNGFTGDYLESALPQQLPLPGQSTTQAFEPAAKVYKDSLSVEFRDIVYDIKTAAQSIVLDKTSRIITDDGWKITTIASTDFTITSSNPLKDLSVDEINSIETGITGAIIKVYSPSLPGGSIEGTVISVSTTEIVVSFTGLTVSNPLPVDVGFDIESTAPVTAHADDKVRIVGTGCEAISSTSVSGNTLDSSAAPAGSWVVGSFVKITYGAYSVTTRITGINMSGYFTLGVLPGGINPITGSTASGGLGNTTNAPVTYKIYATLKDENGIDFDTKVEVGANISVTHVTVPDPNGDPLGTFTSKITGVYNEYLSFDKVLGANYVVSEKDRVQYVVNRVGDNSVLASGGSVSHLIGTQAGLGFISGYPRIYDGDSVFINYPAVGNIPAGVLETKVKGAPTAEDAFNVRVSLPNTLIGVSGVTINIKRYAGYVDTVSGTDVLKDSTTGAFAGVEPGDTVELIHPDLPKRSYTVVKFINNNQLQLDSGTNPAKNIGYVITRENASEVDIVLPSSGSFTGNVGDTETDILVNNNTSTSFSDVRSGDKVRVVRGTEVTSATVIGVIDLNRVQLSRKYPVGASGITFNITRTQTINAPRVLIDGTDYTAVSTDGLYVDDPLITLQANIAFNNRKVHSARTFVNYKFLSLKSANTFLDVSTADDIVSVAGGYDPLVNPLGTGAFLAKLGNPLNTIHVIPLNGEEYDQQAWAEALDVASTKEAHDIVPLTQNVVVARDMFSAHVNARSVVDVGKWAVTWINLPHPYEESIIVDTSGATLSFRAANPPGLPSAAVILYDPQTNMVNVRTGMYVEIEYINESDIKVVVQLKVVKKIDNSTLELEAFRYAPPSGVELRKGSYVKGTAITSVGPGSIPASPLTYNVYKIRTKREQAQALASIAHSISNRRVNYITNETCILPGIDGIAVEVPGFYLGAFYAGLSSFLAPHCPFTNYPIDGFIGVRKSIDYFNAQEIGVIARGGGFHVTQDLIDQSKPYAWIQRTTNTDSVKLAECSFTKNLDEISKALRDARFSKAGKDNIVPKAITKAIEDTNAVLEIRKTNDQQSPIGGELGPQITSASFKGFVTDPANPDTELADIELVLPTPWNYTRYRLFA